MKYGDCFKEIPVLETDRCTLRAFQREDMNAYFNILRDAEVQRYLGGGVPLFDKEPHITNWLANINGRLLKAKKVFTWCIVDKKSLKIIGRIDLGGFVKQSYAEIAYHFDRNFWGKGYATEVVKRVTDFGIDKLLLHRIQGLVRTENIASQKALLKNDYLSEGILRLYPFGKEFHDTVILAYVKGENLKK